MQSDRPTTRNEPHAVGETHGIEHDGNRAGSHTATGRGSTYERDRIEHDDRSPWSANAFGDNQRSDVTNISWGSVIAGVVTFVATLLLLNVATAALGIQSANFGSSNPAAAAGSTAGIALAISMILALLAGGFVAGALAVKGGLLHGFLTWATSMLTAIVLGGIAGFNFLQQAQIRVDNEVTQQQANTATTGLWWTFAGLLLGAVLAAIGGLLGSRSVDRRRESTALRRAV